MNEHPKMLFREGSQMKWDGRLFDMLIVDNAEEEQAAKADGWLTAEDAVKPKETALKPKGTAVESKETAVEPTAPEVDDDAPPTRDELETKAKELGIKFDGRWGDKRLADAIEQALKG